MGLFDFMASPRNRVYVAAGNKHSSGYDLVRDSERPGKYDRKRWVKLGGSTYTSVPAAVYDAQQDDRIILAYKKDSNEIVAHWNLRTKSGSNAGIHQFIFHPVPIILIAIGLISYFTGVDEVLTTSPYAGWLVAGVILASYFYAYFDWQVQVYGQKLVDDYKVKVKQ